ncbi:MAG: hypothetical protein Q8L34_06055 [Candidatus Woesearchaeota archaeon]|nr:hypothetical protein [Candidatus Woesearchaeota archaeon]
MQKRGQAAMEFLMTYGWALLVVLIAIGALAFFGVLNPAKFLPQSCMLGPGLSCEDFKIDSITKNIYVNIRNGFGQDIEYMFVYVDKKSPTGNEMCGGFTGLVAVPTAPLKDGQKAPIQHLTNFLPIGLADGLSCDPNIPSPAFNNCINPVYNTLLPATWPPPYNTIYSNIYDLAISCSQSATLGSKGSKFRQDIVISYKMRNSGILHQRVGSISAQIE